MKKLVKPNEENRRNLKQRLLASLAMLMVAVILTVTVTYAWLILSVAPEVRGISTTIGANGSLEIALLNKHTFGDPNLVPTVVGVSLSDNRLEANETWGNMVDLNDQSYGLQEIVLYPSRLNITGTAGNYKVDRNSSMLLVPSYGSDGRITQLTDKTLAGTFNEDGFYSYVDAEFGVRAIGTAASVSVQSSALAQAKRNINTYISSAISSAKSSVDGVQDLLLKFAAGGDSFSEEDIATLQGMIERLSTSEKYIEDALRQGMVAMAASAVSDVSNFELVRSLVLSGTAISELLNNEAWTKLGYDVPEQFMTWVTEQESMQNALLAASAACGALDPATATKQDVKVILDYLMDLDKVLVGSKPFTEMTKEELVGMVGTGIELTLKPGSGIYADIADFTGNYSASVGSLASLKTASAQNPAYLPALAIAVNALTAADGGGAGTADVKLEDTFGYVLDLAFRCNAYRSDLLLQTSAVQRVYDDSDSDATMGGGSYMEFTTAGDMDFERLTVLMNAVRVAFVDDAGNLLGVAKLNVSNRVLNEANGNVMAPLYLYDFEVGTGLLDKGKLIIGERRKADNSIASLERNIAKAVSTLVWLDGDIVDNTTVSAETNISGVLNLQFASSVDLLPADNASLNNYVVDKDGLNEAVEAAYNDYIVHGQADYTTISWTNFTAVYARAKAVSENPIASENQIYNTILLLEEAENNLQKLDDEVLDLAISGLRDFMGETEEDAYLLLGFDENGNPILIKEATQEQLDQSVGSIKSVNYEKNLRDEGNGLNTPIYTDGSWYALADTLYRAEALKLNPAVTPEQKDMAITQMQLAYEALDFAVYFTAYDLKGAIYYKAIPGDAADPDTYGTWYDSSFRRVLDELTLLELDAYAKKADIAAIDQEDFVDDAVPHITPSVALKTGLYPELRSQTLMGVHWNTPDGFAPTMRSAQYSMMLALMGSHQDTDCTVYKEALSVVGNGTDPGLYELHQVSYDEATRILEKLDACEHSGDHTYDENGDMVAAQQVALIQLINQAQSVPNYDMYGSLEDGEEKTNLGVLHTKVNAAQAVLADDGKPATYAEAQAALDALHAALEANDSLVTYEQEVLLKRAVRNAKTVPNYDDYETLEDGAEKTALTTLHEKVTAAESVLHDIIYGLRYTVTFSAAGTALYELNGAIASIDATLTATALMTNEQAIVLNIAILYARYIEGLEDPDVDNEDMLALRAAVTAAEGELALEDATVEGAAEVLNALNAAIAKFDASLQATEYNTIIQYSVPDAMKSYDVPYGLDMDMPILRNDAPVGEYELTAVLITKSGVLYTATTSFTIYNKAQGVELPRLTDEAKLPAGGALAEYETGEKNKYGEIITEEVEIEVDGEMQKVQQPLKELAWDGKMNVGAKVTLPAAALTNRIIFVGQEEVGTGEYEDRVIGHNPDGSALTEKVEITVTKDVYEALPTTETITEVTYSTSDDTILKWVSGTTFEAKAAGMVTVYVTVETEQGNRYSAQYPIQIEVVDPAAVTP